MESSLVLDLAKRTYPWQRKLLSTDAFATYASERDLSIRKEDVFTFWQKGLLLADRISTPLSDFRRVAPASEPEWNEGPYYPDPRNLRRDYDNELFAHLAKKRKHVELYFHPFRLLFLAELLHRWNIKVPIAQLVSYPAGSDRVYEFQRDAHLLGISNGTLSNFAERLNNLASLAIACDPVGIPHILGVARRPFEISEDFAAELSSLHRGRLGSWLKTIGIEVLKEQQAELVRSAETMDDNTELHTLARLAQDRYFERRSKFAAALELRAMAECLRRAAELTFGEQLPEEDEVGFGVWFPGLKRKHYGTDRVLDPPNGPKAFAKTMNLHFGLVTRVYVEGATEYGAVHSAVGHMPTIEIVNLQGLVAARGGKGLAFRDDLRRNKARGIYSCVVIDGDVSINSKLVRMAFKEGQAFGAAFEFSPSFELCSLDDAELVEVILAEFGESGLDLNHLSAAISRARAGGDLEQEIRRVPGLEAFGKGERWGRAIWRQVHAKCRKLDREEATRISKLFAAVAWIAHSSLCNFERDVDGFVMDPVTLLPVPKVTQPQ